ncbi:MAG: response regulator [Alphaproteobacteria bacterium]|nr:response regulator [Alphaproteobacteria bacterium]
MIEAIGLIALGAGGLAVWLFARRTEAARRDRALMAAALDALDDAVATVDRSGQVIVANAAWRARVPGSGPVVDGLAAALDIPRDDLAPLSGADQALTTEHVVAGDRADRRAVALAVRPLAGRPGETVWTLSDAAPLARFDAACHAEQARISAFVGTARVGAYSVDRTGRFLHVDPVLAGWLGRDARELVGGLRLADVVTALPDPACPFALCIEEGRAEAHFRRATGATMEAVVDQRFLRAADDRIAIAHGLVRNRTAEKIAADQARLSEERFRRFFEDAPVGIVLLDRAAAIVACNPAFSRMTRRTEAALIGTPLVATFAGDDAARVEAWIAEAAHASAPPAALEVRFGANRETIATLSAGRFETSAEEGAGLIVHLLDVTQQKSLEDQFLQSQKMELVGKLAGGIAHDFNTLLTAMIGFCDLLLLRHSPKDQSFADIMQIKQNANRAANLVRQLLAFSRQQTLQPRVLQLTDVLTEISHLLRRLIGANIELTLAHGRDLGLVKVDQSQFEQVIINLAVNARDAMAEGGTLTVRTANLAAGDPRIKALAVPDGDYVVLEAIDTGHGIAKEHIDKIFDPFFTTKEVGSGTGLGLSTVYGIIKQTGGHIFVDSAPRRGATFTILLPRHQPEATADAREGARDDAAPRRDLTGAGTVLLVEDEDAVRLFGARALRNKGYTVLEARNGEAALEMLGAGATPIDLLITDVVMPGMDGPTLIRQVREKRPELKVIFISGYTEDSFRKRLGEGETVHFLPKPFSLQQLAGKVKEVMNHHAEAAE